MRFDDVYGTETSHEWGKNLSREGSVKNYVEKIKNIIGCCSVVQGKNKPIKMLLVVFSLLDCCKSARCEDPNLEWLRHYCVIAMIA